MYVTSYFGTERVNQKKYSKVKTIKLIVLPAASGQLCEKRITFCKPAEAKYTMSANTVWCHHLDFCLSTSTFTHRCFYRVSKISTVTKRKVICKCYHKIMKANSLEETPILEKIEGRRKRGQQRMRLLDSFTKSTDMSLSKLWVIVKDREVWHAAVHGALKIWTWLNDWTTTTLLWKEFWPPEPHRRILGHQGVCKQNLECH